jgi:AraC family ethanolamine operon transcriptional activator
MVRSTPPSEEVAVSVVLTNDVDEQAAVLDDWAETYQQMSPGRFSGCLRQLQFGRTQLFHESSSHCVHQIGAAWRESLVFVTSDNLTEPARWMGHTLNRNDIGIFRGDTGFEAVAPAGCRILAAAVDSGDFLSYARIVAPEDFSPDKPLDRRLVRASGLHAYFSAFLRQTLDTVMEAPQLLAEEAAQKTLRETLYSQMVELLSTRHRKVSAGTALQRSTLVLSVRDYVNSRSAEVPSVVDICAEFGVSRRSLQYAFEEVVGMNPVAYLRASRLNAVRRDIKATSPQIPVLDLAARWGFWHPSYFSASYKQLFGELPSVTPRATSRW